MPRFSLRTILIFITLFGATVGCWCERAERQRRIVRALQDLDCVCQLYDEPAWLTRLPESVREFRGGHYWCAVERVTMGSPSNDPFDDPGPQQQSPTGSDDELLLCKQLTSLTELAVGTRIREGDLEKITSIPGLTSLEFEVGKLRESDLPYLRKLSRLKEVTCHLKNAELDVESIRYLSELTNTVMLTMQYCDDEGLKYLSPLSRLEDLEIFEGDFTSGDFSPLRKFPLRELTLRSMTVPDRGAASLGTISALEHVVLPHASVGDETARSLAKLPHLKLLYVDGTLIDDEGAAALAESKSLEELYIGSNSIGAKGLAALATSPSLKDIRVRGIPLSREELVRFGSSPVLRCLDPVSRGAFSRARLLELATELPNDEERRDVWLSHDDLVEFARRHEEGTENLQEWFTPFSDERLTLIATIRGTNSLDLSYSAVTDEGFATVARMESLKSLRCAGTNVSSAGLQHLVDLSKLESLDLRDCRNVDDSAIHVLCRMPSLKELNLEGTNVSRGGIVQLAKAGRLKELKSNVGEIRHTTLDNELAFYLGEVFDPPSQILSIDGSKYDAWFFARADRASLDLSNDGPLSNEQVSRLAQAWRLLELRAEMDDDQFELLRDLWMLQKVELIGPRVGKRSLRSALQQEDLTELSLRRVRLTSDDWSELRGAKITSLVLDDVDVSEVRLDLLTTMPNLREVTLKGSAVSDESVSRVCESCSSLTAFTFDAKRCSPQVVRQTIRRLPNLTDLNLGEGCLTLGQLAMLRGQKEYEEFAKENRVYPSPDDPPHKIPPFEEVNLSGPWIDDAIGLPDGETYLVSEVSLRNATIGGPTLQRLAKFAELQMLDLSGASIRDSDVADVGGFINLETLSLTDCAIGAEALKAFLGCRHLSTLDVARTNVDDQALATVAQWRRLGSLNLSCTEVTDRGLELLSGTKSLDEIRLSATSVTDAGVKLLGGLKRLKTLDLSDTIVGDEGAITLGSLLQLESLDLRHTKVTDLAIDSLVHLRRARVIDLRGTSVTLEGAKKLRHALPRCRVILTEADGVMLDKNLDEWTYGNYIVG